MPVYGPTGGDFARDTAGYLNKGMSGLGSGLAQGLMNRAMMREEKRLNDIKNSMAVIEQMLPNYQGDLVQMAQTKEGKAPVKHLLDLMYMDQEGASDLIMQGLESGNPTAKAQAFEKVKEEFSIIAGLEQEKQNESQMLQGLKYQPHRMVGEVGEPQGYDSFPGASAGPAGAFVNALGQRQRQGAQQGAPQAGQDSSAVPMSFGREEGVGVEAVEPQRPDRTPRGTGTEMSSPQAVANRIFSAKANQLQQRAGREPVKAREIVESLLENNTYSEEITNELQNIVARSEEGVAPAGQAGVQQQEGPSRTEGTNIVVQHQADTGKYQEVYSQTGSHYETSRQVVGFNEPDIHEAVDQLNQTGSIENKNVKSFLNKHNLPETAEGVAQALTYMNTVIMGKGLPETTEQFGGLNPEAMGRYSELSQMLGREADPRPRESARLSPPAEQLISSLGEGFEILSGSATDGFKVKRPDGRIRNISAEDALTSGYIQLDPVVEENRKAYDLSAKQALVLEQYLKNPFELTDKDKRLAESTSAMLWTKSKAGFHTPQNRSVLNEGIDQAVREAPEVSFITQSMIDGFAGETEQDRRAAFIRSFSPESVQQERNFNEAMRQFNLRYGLDVAKLKQDERIALMRYAASEGQSNALNNLAFAENQKATLGLTRDVLSNTVETILKENINDPEEFRKKLIEFTSNTEFMKNLLKIQAEAAAGPFEKLPFSKPSNIPDIDIFKAPWFFPRWRNLEEKALQEGSTKGVEYGLMSPEQMRQYNNGAYNGTNIQLDELEEDLLSGYGVE